MKSIAKYSVLVLLILSSFSAKSQVGIFGAGYHMGFFVNDSLKYVIDRYNETRNFLDKELKYPNYMDGLHFEIAFGTPVYFSLGYVGQTAQSHAEGVDNTGTLQRRVIKYSYHTFDMGVGYFKIPVGGGFGFKFGSEALKSKVGPAEEVKNIQFSDVQSDLQASLSAFLVFLAPLSDGIGLYVKPYFMLSLFRTDYANFNAFINPATYLNDPTFIRGRLGGLGCSFMLAGYWGG